MSDHGLKRLGVYPDLEALPASLASAVSRLFPLRFESGKKISNAESLDAVLVLNGAPDSVPQGKPCFRFEPGERRPLGSEESHRVRFGTSSVLDSRLRNRTLTHGKIESLQAVEPGEGDTVLARVDGEPVWVCRLEAGVRMDRVSLSLPALVNGDLPFEFLNDGNYLRLLPLLHFLRQVTAGSGWEPAPLRACFMFDDPNLHWRSYGFLDYPALVRRARQDGFHVALATVPLDVLWGAHRPTVQLFRENPEQLSLLIHGNDHTRAELGQERSAEGHLQLAAQALRRVARFEGATGLSVGRVMAPPHGAYAKEGLGAMFNLGFEGACISPWSLRDWERSPAWPPTFGLEMAELMEGRFPVLPRFRLSESCETTAVIAAFLGRPIIPVGHHDSVSDGLDLLERIAGIIRSLGEVRWCGPESMLRSNFSTRREGATLWVRPYSARVRVEVPPAVTELRVAPPDSASYRLATAALTDGAGEGGKNESIRVRPGDRLELIADGLGAMDFARVASPARSCWGLPRRVLCEVRDRLQPVVYKARRLAST